MAQYHVTDKGPRACSTTPDRCPYGRQGEPHFDSIGGAQEFYEEKMEREHGLLATASAREFKKTSYYKFYSFLDKLDSSSPATAKIIRYASYRGSSPKRRTLGAAPSKHEGNVRSKMKRQGFSGQVKRLNGSRGGNSFESTGEAPASVKQYFRNLERQK